MGSETTKMSAPRALHCYAAKDGKPLPDCEGVWWTGEKVSELPPIVVLQVYGDLKWRQIGCNGEWRPINELGWKDWKMADIPFFIEHGKSA